MTGGAVDLKMRACQGEWSARMIEGRPRPTGRAVADRTVLRKASRHMVGISGCLVIGQMARRTVPRRTGIASIRVALGARHGCVGARQRESRKRTVIEACSRPA